MTGKSKSPAGNRFRNGEDTMAWIRQVPVDDHYTDMVKPLSLLPGAMDAVYEMTMAISFGSSTLTRVQEEAIATSVSVSNRCRY